MTKRKKASVSPRLSLAMIVKNESAHLETCLSHARPFVDEIVVIDTGSTDGTQDIARKYADVFEEIEWPDSFSIARNYSMDKASGDFILILDGDEYISEASEWQAIREAIAVPLVAGLHLRVRNVLPDNQIIEADCHAQVRVVKNRKAIRYTGSVHNQISQVLLNYCAKHQELIVEIPVTVTHLGYALPRERMKEKYAARMHLLKNEVEHAKSEEEKAYYQYQLANVLDIMQDYQEAAGIFNDLNYACLTDENAFYTHMSAAQANRKAGDYESALRHADQLLTMNASEPMTHFIAGIVLLDIQRWDEGLLFLIEAYKKNKAGNSEIRFPINVAFLLLVIGDVCVNTHRLERARFFYAEYLVKYPNDERVKSRLAEVEAHLSRQQLKSVG